MSLLQKWETKQFALYKYEPEQILFQHKLSKIVYQYYELPSDNHQFPLTQQVILRSQILSMYIQHPIRFEKGFLFQKELTSLANQLNNKRKIFANKSSFKNQYCPLPYEQQQLVNTLLPIIQAIKQLKSMQIVHGNLSPSTIIVTKTGQIMLRNIKSKNKNLYYSSRQSSNIDDFKALGYIILQCMTLKSIQQLLNNVSIEQLFQVYLHNSYSKGFLVGLYSLISQKLPQMQSIKLITGELTENDVPRYDQLQKIISINTITKDLPIMNPQSNEQISLVPKAMHSTYSRIKQLKEKIIKATQRTKINEKLNAKKCCPSYSYGNNNLNFLNKNYLVDSQNKISDEEIKKKHMQRIAKIIEKSNVLSQQFAKKKATDSTLRKIGNSKVVAVNEDKQTTWKQINPYLKKFCHGKEDTLQFSSQKKLLSPSKNNK